MEIAAIKDALKGRGWTVEVKAAAEVGDLVDVSSEGLFKCVDGRLSDRSGAAMRGPKTLGGVYALAAMAGDTSLAGLERAAARVAELGFVPCVHSDDHHGTMGCGFFKLWKTGQLDDLASPEYTSDEGKDFVEGKGGVHETLTGAHVEQVVMINLVEGKTLEPDNTRFIVDAWWLARAGVDAGAYLTRAAETVEKLNGPKKAVLIT